MEQPEQLEAVGEQHIMLGGREEHTRMHSLRGREEGIGAEAVHVGGDEERLEERGHLREMTPLHELTGWLVFDVDPCAHIDRRTGARVVGQNPSLGSHSLLNVAVCRASISGELRVSGARSSKIASRISEMGELRVSGALAPALMPRRGVGPALDLRLRLSMSVVVSGARLVLCTRAVVSVLWGRVALCVAPEHVERVPELPDQRGDLAQIGFARRQL